MPGETVLPVEQYPDDFQIITWSGDPGTAQYVPLFMADRDLILDKAWVRWEVDAGAACVANLAKVADGTIFSGTNVNLTTDTIDMDAGTVGTQYAWTVDAANNLIAAKSLVILEFGAAAPAALGVVTITMRVRSRRQ